VERLRLAVIARHFWPHYGPREMAIADVAAAIGAAGHGVEVLTIRWDREWTRSFRFRELAVTRISRQVSGPWGMFRYLRALNRHVQETSVDGMLVFGLQAESWAAIRHFVDRLPVVVVIDQQELNQKKSVHRNSRKMSILKRTKKILVDSRATATELVSRYPLNPDLVSVVPPSVRMEDLSRPTTQTKLAARVALSDAHPILRIDPEQPLVLCGASQFADRGLDDLIESWRRVLDRFPTALLWVLGDGLKARRIWELICDLRLADSIVMPGFFDDWEDLLAAADLYVHPLRAPVVCPALVRALAAGACCLATQSDEVSGLVEKNINGFLVPAEHPAAMAEAIIYAFDHQPLRDRLGIAARERALERWNLDRRVLDYVRPFLAEESVAGIHELQVRLTESSSDSPLDSATERRQP
jgi:glycosyltransferase involved in cell wall biosynthesis